MMAAFDTRFLTLWFCLSMVVGCGRGLVDVKARAMLDGKPIEGATITLVRIASLDSNGRPACGYTDADGIASFTTYAPGDGVVPGNYKVCVVKTPAQHPKTTQPSPEIPKTVDSEEDFERYSQAISGYNSPQQGRVPHLPTLLPLIYATPTTTPLVCSIPPEEGELVFRLQSRSRTKNR